MSIEEIKNIIEKGIEDIEVNTDENCTPQALKIGKAHLIEVCKLLHSNDQLYFDMLSCITGIDNGSEENTMEVVYNLYSIPFEIKLMLKVELDRNKPSVHSVGEIWKTALWHERETFDLLGIDFENHPDLRRILLPHDWEGHPLRKDYKHQDYYRGIKVEY